MATRGRPRRRPLGERPPFSWLGGALCLEFVNTVTWVESDPPVNERFRAGRDVVDWARAAGVIGDPVAPPTAGADVADALLQPAREARETLHSVLRHVANRTEPPRELMARFNEWIEWSAERLQLVPDATGPWKWEARSGAATTPADLTAAVLAPVVRSAVELLRSPEVELLRDCANPQCGWLFLDRSRNGNRRWCDMRECGSRAKARRHYRRRQAGLQQPDAAE